MLDPKRAGRDASKIADEVVSHLAGIVGGDYGQLKPQTKTTVSYYKVYPRAYWHMSSAYVCVADVK